VKIMTELKQFQRNEEDFICEQCGLPVSGNGYTNHCPRCLWSKHVDVNPGDRQATCRGSMEPIGIESKGGKYIVVHHCIVCGFGRRNKIGMEDDFDTVLRISAYSIRGRSR
jgi:ribosomal protein L37E